ncbi:MAG: recombination mediator RecR [Rickettsiales bacterium]|jgi:recombination protein RecR|nr:recombination mediator RecR [Rickettsiales bacterium]
MKISAEIDDLIKALSRIPGFGRRAAAKAAIGLIGDRAGRLLPLMDALREVADKIKRCPVCGNFDTDEPCSICADPARDSKTLCVVSDMASLWALEKGGFFHGRYHLTGGIVSAINGIEPKDLNLGTLADRIRGQGVSEVIFALPATIDAKITASYIAGLIKDTGVKITVLAHGVPIGGELDYLDSGTIEEALNGRRDM